MTFLDLFSDKSDRYASARPQYPEALFDYIASLAPGAERAREILKPLQVLVGVNR